MGTTAREPTRRAFLAGAASTVALLLSGCGRGDTAASATPTTAFRPERAPTVPGLSEMEPRFVEDARAYLVGVPPVLRERARALLPPEVHRGVDAGLLALSDVCPSDQLQLRFCETSRWFACPGCGSMFDILGAWRAGPAPRGMTMFGLAITDDADREVSVVRHPKVPGLPNGTRLAAHEPAGPFCL